MNSFLSWLLLSSLALMVAVMVVLTFKLFGAKFTPSLQYRLTKQVVLLVLLAFGLNTSALLLPVKIPITVAAFPNTVLSALSPTTEDGASRNISQSGTETNAVITTEDSHGTIWTKLLFTLWIVGATVSVGTAVVRYCLFLLKVHKLSEPSPKLTAIYNSTSLPARGKRKGTVWVTCGCSVPLSCGLLRPIILLPTTDYSAEELHYILRHEGQHIEGRDSLYQAMMIVLAALYWFHPAVYLLAGILQQNCELACDESVLRNESENSRLRYAQILIKNLACTGNDAYKGYMMGFAYSVSYHKTKERLLMIKNGKTHAMRSPLFYLILIIMLVSFLLLGTVNAWSLTYPAAPPVEQAGKLLTQAESDKKTTHIIQELTEEATPSSEQDNKGVVLSPVDTTNIVREKGSATLFIVNERSNIRSMTDGVIIDTWDLKVEVLLDKPRTTSGWRGNYIYVQAPTGIIYHYIHLGTIAVEVGDVIKAGDILGTTGKSGAAAYEQCGVYTSVYDEANEKYTFTDLSV